MRLMIIYLLLATLQLSGDTFKHYFYFDQKYGSESQFGPVNTIANIGMICSGRFDYVSGVHEIQYQRGAKTIFESYRHPIQGIKNSGGYKQFIGEFIPLDPMGAWVPNYTLHLIGEGMTYRKLAEYYDHHNVTYPKLWAALTVTTAQFLNEIVEVGNNFEPSSDPVADILFNIAGMIAFSFDPFANLFHNEWIRLNFWPGQPVIDLKSGVLFNQLEQFSMKISLGRWTDWKFYFNMGMPGGFGISIPINQTDSLSIAASTEYISSPKEIPKDGKRLTSDNIETDDVNFGLSLFWDRNESLMSSLIITAIPNLSLRLNIYPGLLKVGGLGIGGYMLFTENYGHSIGITFQHVGIMPGFRF